MPTNLLKTGLLLAVMTVIFVAMGALVGGASGMVIAFLIALGMNIFSLWNSDTVVLKMFKAQEVGPRDAPELHELVGRLADRAGLPMPRVYIMHNAQPNAFATGRGPSSSALCASTGLLDGLTREELAGVLAHELAHVKNRDTLTMTLAATIGGAISMFANMLQFGFLFGRRNSQGGVLGTIAAVLVAPLAAAIVQMAISRSREYEADRVGAAICGNPLWLASALRKIQEAARHIANPDAERAPAAAHVFIINPLTGTGFDNWFSTHPNTENRISELEKLAAEWARSNNKLPVDLPRDDGSTRTSSLPGGSGARGPWS